MENAGVLRRTDISGFPSPSLAALGPVTAFNESWNREALD